MAKVRKPRGLLGRWRTVIKQLRRSLWRMRKRRKILILKSRLKIKKLRRWWRINERRYGWRWRASNAVIAAVVITSIAMPTFTQIFNNNRYLLNDVTKSLVGNPDPTLAKQLTFDAQTQTYEFNKNAVSNSSTLPSQLQRNNVGASDSKGSQTYALDVPTDITQGVTYHEVNSQLSFKLVPQFGALTGQTVDNHLVYPLNGGSQAVYTLKGNGLKEDIVVQHASQDTMSFSYKLDLPSTLEAKVIPDSDGAIGIYSADPSLFGNISYGSSTDQAAVQKARVNGAKTYLVFGLPAPVIKAAGGASIGDASARFTLSGNTLTVTADGLTSIKSAFTLDPSVTVTSSSDFTTTGNSEDNINFSTSGQISRNNLNSGTLTGTWSTGPDLITQVRETDGAAAYNGYMYVWAGEYAAGSLNDTQYDNINTNGSLGATWTAGTNLNTARGYAGNFEYNGYLYSIGGTDGTNVLSTYEYAAINPSTHAIGSWTQKSASGMGIREGMGIAVWNGYVYLTGGDDGVSVKSDVIYAPINGDGTLGTFTTSANTFTTARTDHRSVAYNGYLYVLTGTNANETAFYGDTQYAHINNDGSIGAFATTASLPSGEERENAEVTIDGGYIYVMGGYQSLGSTRFGDIFYAPINANGSIGAWQETSDILNGCWANSAPVIYNGVLYLIGGFYGPTGNTQDHIIYIPLDKAGTASGYTTSSHTFTTTRNGSQEVAYGGYLYVMGGYNGTNTPVATVYRATINGDGSLSTFTADASMPTGLSFFGAVANDGSLYAIGGCTSRYSNCTTASNDSAVVYETDINDSDGSLNGWGSLTGANITTARYGLNAVVLNNVIFIMGGLNASTFKNDIQYHPISSHTISGAWSNSAQNIGTARAYMSAAINGSNIYIGGGCSAGALTCTTAVTTLQLGTINIATNDLTGALTTLTNSFTNGRGEFGMAINNGYIYIAGGRSNTTNYADTQYAPLNNDGTISSGAWKTSVDSVLPNARYGFGFTVVNGNMYVAGGYDNTTYYNDTQIAQINNGGSGNTGSWSSVGSSLITPVAGAGSFVAYNGYVYAVGGLDSAGNPRAVAERAQLIQGGGIGSWTSTGTASLPLALSGNSLVAYNGYLYSVQGTVSPGNSGNAIYNTYYAKINPDGTLGDGSTTAGTWHISTTMFPSADGFGNGVESLDAVAYNGYLYAMGGNWCSANCGTVQTQYARINADGSLGGWTISTDLPESIISGLAFATNGYVYIVGGENNSGGTNTSVMLAPLNASTGAIGGWSYSSDTPQAIVGGAGGYYDGYIYVTGGFHDDPYFADKTSTFYAPVNADGSIGNWQQTTSLFTNARESLGGYMYGGYLYITGGGSGGTTYGDTQSTPLSVIPHQGQYSKLVDLGSASTVTGITYNGTVPNNATNLTFRAAGSSGIFSSAVYTVANLPIGVSGNCTTTAQYGVRYLLVNVTLDDSTGVSPGTGGQYPEVNGTNANLTDFTVNYNTGAHPAPNIRLRGGQTLQTGTLSALDTCFTNGPAPVVASVGNDDTTGPDVPTGVVAGSLVIVAVNVEWNETAVVPDIDGANVTGFTLGSYATVAGTGGFWEASYFFYKYATGTESGMYTVNESDLDGVSPDEGINFSARITGGPASGNPFVDSFKSAGSTNASSTTIPSFTPGGNYSLLLGTFWNDNTSTNTLPSGWTSDIAGGSGYHGSLGHITQTTAAATGNLVFGTTTSSDPLELIATIRTGP